MKPFRTFFASIALAFAVLAAPFVPHSPIGDLAPQTQAQALADYLENKIVDHIFRGTSYTAPSELYVALFTSACSDSSAGTEVSGGSYARAQLDPSGSNWANTQASGTGASSGTGGQTSNSKVVASK